MSTDIVDFLDLVRATATHHRMFRRGERVLVAVSGGPDSTALWAALVALAPERKLRLRAAYVDHGLRPAAARREAQRVRELGRRWGVPATLISRKIRRGRGESPESAARRVRYAALVSIARKYRCGTVALGHTRDDQAETVLLWILRGVGFSGLAGIPPVRREGTRHRGNGGLTARRRIDGGQGIRIVRPLLQISRQEVEVYLRAQWIRPLLDRSNLSRRYLRNRIRHDLIGQLEKEYNPRLREHLASLAELAREQVDWMERQTRERFRAVARVRAGTVRLDRRELRRLAPVLRRELLRLSVRKLQGHHGGFAQRHWRLLDDLAVDGVRGALDLPHGLRAEARGGKLIVSGGF